MKAVENPLPKVQDNTQYKCQEDNFLEGFSVCTMILFEVLCHAP
jgi:hypothetical protein